MIALIAYLGLIVRQLDIVGAYLNGSLPTKEVIYMIIPKGLHISRKLKKFCKLLQTIYWLKQSRRVWNKRFVGYLKKMGFFPTTAHASVLVNYEKRIIIGVYIDDVIYAAKELQLLDEFETQLKEEFEVKLLAEAKLILGMLVKRDIKRKTLHLSHTHYIRDLLSIYKIIEANRVGTPMIKGSTILLGKSEDAEFDVTDYQRLVRKLIHLSQTTRSDLAFVVSRLWQHMADLRLGH